MNLYINFFNKIYRLRQALLAHASSKLQWYARFMLKWMQNQKKHNVDGKHFILAVL